ncbi:uncharacterized protein KZ484_025849 [Pholidichthys leucotaenia]
MAIAYEFYQSSNTYVMTHEFYWNCQKTLSQNLIQHQALENGLSAGQQLQNQEVNSSFGPVESEHLQIKEEQEEPELLEIKVEQEEFCTGQDIEQSVLLSAASENQDEEGSQCVDSGSTENKELKAKKRQLETKRQHEDVQKQLELMEEEALTIQQLWNQERNSLLDLEEHDIPQIKEDSCDTQEEDRFELKQDTDTVMVTLNFEKN